ncbi:MAG: hypothetical protein ACFE9L_09280 [Candidatus Hodarchaeota archaeon]
MMFEKFLNFVEEKAAEIRDCRECGCDTCLEKGSGVIGEVKTSTFQLVMTELVNEAWFEQTMATLGWKRIEA